MTTDLTFITNEANHTLKDRFHALIQDARFFDVLVGDSFSPEFLEREIDRLVYQLYRLTDGKSKLISTYRKGRCI